MLSRLSIAAFPVISMAGISRDGFAEAPKIETSPLLVLNESIQVAKLL